MRPDSSFSSLFPLRIPPSSLLSFLLSAPASIATRRPPLVPTLDPLSVSLFPQLSSAGQSPAQSIHTFQAADLHQQPIVMSQWNISDRHKRICLFPMPRIPRLGPKARDAGVYVSGALFALGWWFFIDAVIYSKNWGWNIDQGVKKVSVEFVDWVPGICSTIGMLVINCIDKAALRGDTFSFSSGGGTSVAWKARVFLFIGFAFMAGGLAGSISVLCIKYLLQGYGDPFNFWGICNVIQNACIMTSAAILWVAQNTESEYQYSFAI